MSQMGGDMELIVLRELRDKLLAENEALKEVVATLEPLREYGGNSAVYRAIRNALTALDALRARGGK